MCPLPAPPRTTPHAPDGRQLLTLDTAPTRAQDEAIVLLTKANALWNQVREARVGFYPSTRPPGCSRSPSLPTLSPSQVWDPSALDQAFAPYKEGLAHARGGARRPPSLFAAGPGIRFACPPRASSSYLLPSPIAPSVASPCPRPALRRAPSAAPPPSPGASHRRHQVRAEVTSTVHGGCLESHAACRVAAAPPPRRCLSAANAQRV